MGGSACEDRCVRIGVHLKAVFSFFVPHCSLLLYHAHTSCKPDSYFLEAPLLPAEEEVPVEKPPPEALVLSSFPPFLLLSSLSFFLAYCSLESSTHRCPTPLARHSNSFSNTNKYNNNNSSSSNNNNKYSNNKCNNSSSNSQSWQILRRRRK